MPLLQQLHKEEAVKGLKLSGQPNDTKCETCLLSKFTRFPFHGVAGKSKAALELVHMDLVGPFPVQGRKGERYFLTIVDDWKSKGWLLWEPSKNVLFDSRDVKFVENIMYGKWEKQPEARSLMTKSLHTAFTHQYNLRAWIMR
ncbi:hypothetical protein CLOP_g20024 [Closterium sp. NIES-67]|nr:hypothetical protein CLOP_g20024 [Closterium sp. NIES-67]